MWSEKRSGGKEKSPPASEIFDAAYLLLLVLYCIQRTLSIKSNVEFGQVLFLN